jgi:hypothetical protein
MSGNTYTWGSYSQHGGAVTKDEDKAKLEETCRTFKVPATVTARHKFPKKYPTANVNVNLTPGFYDANAIIDGRKYKTYIYCSQDQQSECYISKIPSKTVIKNFELNKLDYLGGLETSQIQKLKTENKDRELTDFIESVERTGNLKSYLLKNSKSPDIVDQLAKVINDQIEQGMIDQKYIDEARQHQNITDYIYYLIYRMILVNSSVIVDDLDTLAVKNIVNRGLVKQSFDDLEGKLTDRNYIDLITILRNYQRRGSII